MTRRSRVAAAALGAVPVLCCAFAGAQTMQDDQAKIQFRQGVELYEAGKFDQATTAFQRAYDLKPSYKILFNIAQAHNETGHYAAALIAYVQYLADGGDEVPADRVAQVKAEIERLNALVGMLVVECPVDGAKVKVDKEARGETPLSGPIFVDLGKHEVAVSDGREVLFEEVLEVAGGQRVVVEVEPLPEPEGGAETAEGESEGEVSPEVGEGEQEPGASALGIAGWVSVGVGGALLIAGIATGGSAMSKNGELEDECSDGVCPESADPSVQDERDDLALATDVLIPLGAVVAAAGAVMLIVDAVSEDEEEPVASARLHPTALPGGAGLVLEGRF